MISDIDESMGHIADILIDHESECLTGITGNIFDKLIPVAGCAHIDDVVAELIWLLKGSRPTEGIAGKYNPVTKEDIDVFVTEVTTDKFATVEGGAKAMEHLATALVKEHLNSTGYSTGVLWRSLPKEQTETLHDYDPTAELSDKRINDIKTEHLVTGVRCTPESYMLQVGGAELDQFHMLIKGMCNDPYDGIHVLTSFFKQYEPMANVGSTANAIFQKGTYKASETSMVFVVEKDSICDDEIQNIVHMSVTILPCDISELPALLLRYRLLLDIVSSLLGYESGSVSWTATKCSMAPSFDLSEFINPSGSDGSSTIMISVKHGLTDIDELSIDDFIISSVE